MIQRYELEFDFQVFFEKFLLKCCKSCRTIEKSLLPGVRYGYICSIYIRRAKMKCLAECNK